MTKRHNDPPPLRDQLCYAIYTAGIAIQRAYKPVLDELGLTYSQYLVLNVLWAQESRPWCPSQISLPWNPARSPRF